MFGIEIVINIWFMFFEKKLKNKLIAKVLVKSVDNTKVGIK